MSEKNSSSQLPKTSSSSSRRLERNEDLPSTSGIKAEFSIKITIAPEDNKSLQSLDELENILRQKAEAEDESSFVTVPSFTKEIATSMEPGMIQIATKKHQSVAAIPVVMENVPPPPYYNASPSRMENNTSLATPQTAPVGGSPPPYTPYVVPRINSFNDVKMRNQYVLKVFLILAVQLLLTLGFIAMIIFDNRKRQFMLKNEFLYYLALIMTLGVYIFLVCCPQVRRTTPINFICLGFLVRLK
nr:unnamed protein product [Callosobruchus analis]